MDKPTSEDMGIDLDEALLSRVSRLGFVQPYDDRAILAVIASAAIRRAARAEELCQETKCEIQAMELVASRRRSRAKAAERRADRAEVKEAVLVKENKELQWLVNQLRDERDEARDARERATGAGI